MHEPVLAEEIMTRTVRKLTVKTRVGDAAEFLLRHGISGAPVVGAHGRPVGVFTMNDLARHVQSKMVETPDRTLERREMPPPDAASPWEGLREAQVGTLMTVGLVTVFQDATVEEVIRSMVSQKIHRVFVISEDMELLGVITTMDVIKWMDRQAAAERRAHPPGQLRTLLD